MHMCIHGWLLCIDGWPSGVHQHATVHPWMAFGIHERGTVQGVQWQYGEHSAMYQHHQGLSEAAEHISSVSSGLCMAAVES